MPVNGRRMEQVVWHVDAARERHALPLLGRHWGSEAKRMEVRRKEGGRSTSMGLCGESVPGAAAGLGRLRCQRDEG